MIDRKILKFPTSKRAPTAIISKQRDLFDQIDGACAKIVFLDISELNEDRLLQMLAQNIIAAVVDLRPRPIFRAPKFRHKYVVSYLYRNRIRYIEAGLIGNVLTKEKLEIGLSLIPAISEGLETGITIFIYDDSTKEKDWVSNLRSYLKRDLGSWTELHPSVLTRIR